MGSSFRGAPLREPYNPCADVGRDAVWCSTQTQGLWIPGLRLTAHPGMTCYIPSNSGGSNQLVSDSPPSTTMAAPVT
jgi:hypothetical protein